MVKVTITGLLHARMGAADGWQILVDDIILQQLPQAGP
jgi:hypothetical protein